MCVKFFDNVGLPNDVAAFLFLQNAFPVQADHTNGAAADRRGYQACAIASAIDKDVP